MCVLSQHWACASETLEKTAVELGFVGGFWFSFVLRMAVSFIGHVLSSEHMDLEWRHSMRTFF